MKEKKKDIDLNALHSRDLTILLSVFFILSLTYFLTLADYILSFQKEQFLFIFSADYLNTFLGRPGGLLEYAGRFLMQFYELPVAGAIILASVITVTAFLFYKIIVSLRPDSQLAIPLAITAASLLLLMQSQYYHFMQYNLGYVAVLALFLLTIKLKNSYISIILLPFLYYLTGAFSLIYLATCCIFFITAETGRKRLIKPGLMLITGALSFYLFRDVLFFVSSYNLHTNPFPLIDSRFHKSFFVLLTFIIFISPLTGKFDLTLRKIQAKKYFSLSSGILVILFTVYLALKLYNPIVSGVLKLEKYAYDGNWDGIINYESQHQSGNLISQYYYNTALAEKDMLCEKMFSINQSSGTKSLILPWGDQHLERGALFFYAAGLVNEAHRWAYEEMVVYGLRPHNILMLIRTDLLDRNFRMAKKYIDILKKTCFYRQEALHYENLIEKPDKILEDKELGPVERIIPGKDFFMYIDLPEDNLPSLYEFNPQNTKAFEYMMAWLLMEKDIATVVSNIHLMKAMGYTRLPRHIEEAVLIYYNSQHTWPDLGGLSIDPATLSRFDQYLNAFVQTRNNNPARLQETMRSSFGDTFWYYFHFIQTQPAAKK